MATLVHVLTSAAWVSVSSGGHPMVLFAANDDQLVYAYVGTVEPLIGATGIALIGKGTQPFDPGPLPSGTQLWLRAATTTGTTVAVIDSGFGGASSTPVTVANTLAEVGIDITRPGNATPYNALDVLGATAAALTFASFGEAGKMYMITQARLRIDVAAIPSGMVGWRLHTYNVTPPSAPADNAAFDLAAGDRASYLGYLDMSAPIDAGATLVCQDLNIGKQVKLLGTSLFGLLQTLGGFTPAGNSEVYHLDLTRVEL